VKRKVFDSSHEEFRYRVRDFLTSEVIPFHAQWEVAGISPREIWAKAGKLGLLGMPVPEEFGGKGRVDYRYNAVLLEELEVAGATGLGFPMHDIVSPYLLRYANEEQKRRWLPRFCSGELITGIAMTEPGAGSDLRGIQTTAVRTGENYVVSGAKTYIGNGINGDLFLVVCRTSSKPKDNLSILVLEDGMVGFRRGRNLEKIGMKALDNAELFFDEVSVPASNLLGEEGRGLEYLKANLPRERLNIAVKAVAACHFMIEITLKYVKERVAFGKAIGSFQNTQFILAELETERQIAQVFVDRCIAELNANNLSAEDAAMAKWWTSELQKRTADSCLQLHGGSGYMSQSRISKAFLDARVQTIYGGTTEIMKGIISRNMGL
jgi:alkylation response protein AidB-like acyl-CoA dehydrogenase